MSNTPQGADSPLEIVDRRLCARRLVPSLAYLDLGDNNGGVILNIGEDGLAVTLVEPLSTDVVGRMRFQLPGSSDWLEAKGKITRISESKKEAALRFVDFSEESRDRIRNWVSLAEPPGQSQMGPTGVSAAKRQVLSPLAARAAKSAEFRGLDEIAREEDVGSVPVAETDARSGEEEGPAPSHAPREERLASNRVPGERLGQDDRRVHVRRAVPSLAYVDLGENNGGIILNISESGLAVTSAAPFYTDVLAQMRFQLPGSSDWLEARGEIVRISESKKEAGLRFVELREDINSRIKGWMSSDASPTESPRGGAGAREKIWRRLEMPIMGIPPQHANPELVTREDAQASMSAARLASTFTSTGTWAADSTPSVLRPKLWGAIDHQTSREAGDGTDGFLLRWRTWTTIAVVVILVAFLAGWFTAEPGIMSRVLARLGRTGPETSETSNGGESSPASSIAAVPDPANQNAAPHGDVPDSSSSAGDFAGRSASNARTETRANGLAAARTNASLLSSSVRNAHSQEQMLETAPASATASILNSSTANTPPQGPGSVVAQNQETSITRPPSPIVNQTEGVPAVGTSETENSPPVKPTETPEVAKTSVSVNFSAYPSIRIPAGLKAQMSQRSSLQIGQLLSRVDPIYPEDAKTQRIEGTVKLHAVIGPDGTIENVAAGSGPALLIPAAIDAVRQWRFTSSSVAGQPVEAEEDIAITFRLLR
ncbi:MAG TPA: TonB family protein [Candidatus Acidoferrales bacterium]|jgi:TonB family protein|nr:TonB family protein [Candidatus Acidoferrales bacterium]